MFTPTITRVIDEVEGLREKVTDHWQIPRIEGSLLAHLVLSGGYTSVCEIGTSYGFSTLHLAAAAKATGGHIHTFDINPDKTQAATRYLERADLLDVVTLHTGDARALIPSLTLDAPFDFVFIDAWKDQSDAYLDAVLPLLARRAALATDNTTSHQKELASFVARLRSLEGFSSCDVPVGNGFELTVRG